MLKRIFAKLFILIIFLNIICAENHFISENIGELCYVPVGAFQRDDNPENISRVSAFYMSRYLITGEQFRKISGYKDFSFFKNIPNSPVETVNWYTAVAFCNLLSMREGLEPVYSINGQVNPAEWQGKDMPQGKIRSRNKVHADWDANGYRLPTEMEWMWAAMGADIEAPGKINRTGYLKAFSGDNFGDEWKEHVEYYAWYSANSKTGGREYKSPQTVGTKRPNELGIYDLSGNVMEWCWDSRDYKGYPEGEIVDYRAREGRSRIIRGGSWERGTKYLAISRRTSCGPNLTFNWLGFRVVRNAD